MPVVVGVSVFVPLVANVPVQPPDAVQLVAFTDDQVMAVELPRAMDVAAKLSVGAAGGTLTVNVTEVIGDVPIALVQVSE